MKKSTLKKSTKGESPGEELGAKGAKGAKGPMKGQKAVGKDRSYGDLVEMNVGGACGVC